ncbi:MAG TPA: ABC transporter permease, partial [Roseiflexaceae bacterium]|nr:ABC transporter permease [Roseiflexaceae bacterium]
ESRSTGRDRVSMYQVKIADAAQAGAVSLAIDNAFANSSNETRTQSEADLITASLQQLGNLGFIIHGVIGAVFFAVLFATGALMMQSLRERIPELAVLKAVGFSDRRVVGLLLAEATIFCVGAAAIGLGIAAALMPLASKIGIQGISGISPMVFAAGVGCALILAFLSAVVPAWRGSRLRVAAALADR